MVLGGVVRGHGVSDGGASQVTVPEGVGQTCHTVMGDVFGSELSILDLKCLPTMSWRSSWFGRA